MAGRTVNKYTRVYVDGYDLSGYSRTIGPLAQTYEEANVTADMGDSIKRYLSNIATISIGTLNGVFDNDAAGLYYLLHSAGVSRNVLVALGMRAAPVAGDEVFMGRFAQADYTASDDAGAKVASATFDNWDGGNLPPIDRPWGTLLHPNSTETAANTAAGYACYATAATTYGGIIMAHVTAASGIVSASLSIDHSTNNSSWANLASTVTAVTGYPQLVLCYIPVGTQINQYVRWQMTLTGTSMTFAMGFVRGLR
jgi:hypothetical protein